MGKARNLEAKLARLKTLRREEPAPGHAAELRAMLADASNFAVADAAEIVGERLLAELVPDLAAAFRRLMVDAAETDKTCRGKLALLEAMNALDADDEPLFLDAVRHIQLEPCWGGSEDTAPALRGTAAFALVRVRARNVEHHLAELLGDKEHVARSMAAQSLGACGTAAAVTLLRFKARSGDAEPVVVSDCLKGLMHADADGSMDFVAGFLDHSSGEVAEGAALALGESRRPAAFEALREHLPRTGDESLRRVMLLAVAITRLPAALDFLIDRVQSNDALALPALAIHRHNPAVRSRVEAALKTDAMRRAFQKEFGPEA